MSVFYFLILSYFLTINIIAAFVTFRDKRKAIRGEWRTRETTLVLLAVLGGAPAMWCTMMGIRHKTTRKKLMVGLPVLSAFHASLGGIFYLFERNHLFF